MAARQFAFGLKNRALRLSLGCAAGWWVASGKVALAERRITISDGEQEFDVHSQLGGYQNDAIEKCTSVDLCKWCSAGDLRRVTQAIEAKCVDINERHPLGWTPLMTAAWNGQDSIVNLLLEHGADVHASDDWSGQHDTGSSRRMRTERLNAFPELSPASTTEGFTALHYAVVHGSLESVRKLILHGANPATPCSGTATTAVDLLKHCDDPHRAAALQKIFKEARKQYDEIERENRRKYPLEDRLKEAIVGQLGPIHAVASAIRRKENGWHDTSKPLVFLFLGSSGIGKTELAKQLAKYLHGSEKSGSEGFIRIDMSEYQHAHEVSKFIGSPPGYVGHEEGGQLTKRLEQKPNSVVLLDEVEKAHPDVLTVMLQVFDEGRITDGKGSTVDCHDAIFIMTSNLAARKIADEAVRLRMEAAAADAQKDVLSHSADLIGRRFKEQVVSPILKKAFKRDEFLGRINETLFFLPFTDNELEALVEKELEHWKYAAKERHDMTLKWTRDLVSYLKAGYNIRYGARSIKHEIDRSCISQLAKAHEINFIGKGHTVLLDFKAKDAADSKTDDIEDQEGVIYSRPDGEVVVSTTPPHSSIFRVLKDML
ncbi:Chaperone protein ClpB [Diplonema papillatum]|nr:Chaperone protein ClpB [Diplonema papillatum]